MARSEKKANGSVIKKLSLFTGVSEDAIALLPNAESIYEVPLTLEDSGIADVIAKKLGLPTKKPNLKHWRELVDLAKTNFDRTINIAVVAKYMDNTDTYLSVFEALKAAAWWNKTNLKITWVRADNFDDPALSIDEELAGFDGIVVPGGFGKRALEGKIKAAQYALKNKVPYLGLCLGLQMAVIAAARNAGLSKATTFELDPDSKELSY